MPLIDHRTVPEIDMRPGIRGQFLANKDLGARPGEVPPRA
jgi:hypothetical protein